MAERDVKNLVSESRVTNDSAAKLRLEDQLELALKDDFNHEGSFAFEASYPSAPNPGLEIISLGIIGLPLCTREAELIKSVAAQSPFGHGDKLVIDSSVRDTWEIDAAQITIRNAAWDSFMEGVVKTARKELGVVACAPPSTCELYKLLLYETGSHFLPHQDTEKAPGMFATIVVVLPSQFTGGEVRVVHGNEEKILGFSASAQFNTTVLAWYADVVHEVKSITSGYRLALSYNLIHTEELFVPLIPRGVDTATHLRQVLAYWAEDVFSCPPDVICYKLEHEYSQSNLRKGVSGLKGVDALKVAHIQEAALGLGFAMGLGQFELHIVSEDQYEDEYSHSKRMRYDEEEDSADSADSDDDEENKGKKKDESSDDGIIEIERESTVSEIVNLEGIPIVPNGSICVDGQLAALVPADAFKKVEPDNEDHQGYQGNAPGTIEQWYKRTVFLIYLKKNEKKIMIGAGGASYALAQLKKANPVEPTDENKEYVEDILGVHWFDNTADLFLLNLGIQWGDFKLWQRTANKCGFAADPTLVGWERVVVAWNKFGFEALRPSFEDAMPCLGTLTRQMHIIDLIKSRVDERPEEPIAEWCERQTSRILSSLLPPDEVREEQFNDVPAYLSVIETKGLDFFTQVIVPQIVKFDNSYKFLIDLVKSLQSRRKEFDVSPSSSEKLQFIFHAALDTALKQWKYKKLAHYHSKFVNSLIRIDDNRVKELAGCLVSTNELALLKTFFESLVEDKEDLRIKFRDIFVPLVPDLVRVQKEYNITIDSDVCIDFFRWLIGMYLQNMLGGKKAFIRHPSVRKVGCADSNCKDCAELDNFIQSTEASHVFRYGEHRRRHLEFRIAEVPDLVSYKTIKEGKPYGLEVKKRKEIVEGSTWEGRQRAAKKFLASFGGDKALKAIMGDKFASVIKALTGEEEYRVELPISRKPLDKLSSPLVTQSSALISSNSGGKSGVGTKSGSVVVTKPIAGVKRKSRSGINGAVIDLTTP